MLDIPPFPGTDTPVFSERFASQYKLQVVPHLPRLKDVLYPGLTNYVPDDISNVLFFRSFVRPESTPTFEQQVTHIERLCVFLEDKDEGGIGRPVRSFVNWGRRASGWPSKEGECRYLCDLLYTAIGCTGMPQNIADVIFETIVTMAGFSRSVRDPTQHSFTKFCLRDFVDADLSVERTSSIYEHLELNQKESKVKVFEVSASNFSMLFNYSANRMASVLGLGSLGDEIFASLYGLVGDDGQFRAPECRFIVDSELSTQDRALFFGRMLSPHGPPRLLAGRIELLDREIRSRRRWWNALARDIRKQKQSQPLFFWGTILAVFFGVCTTLQTIFSGWSVVLAYRQ